MINSPFFRRELSRLISRRSGPSGRIIRQRQDLSPINETNMKLLRFAVGQRVRDSRLALAFLTTLHNRLRNVLTTSRQVVKR